MYLVECLSYFNFKGWEGGPPKGLYILYLRPWSRYQASNVFLDIKNVLTLFTFL